MYRFPVFFLELGLEPGTKNPSVRGGKCRNPSVTINLGGFGRQNLGETLPLPRPVEPEGVLDTAIGGFRTTKFSSIIIMALSMRVVHCPVSYIKSELNF